jgi:hypothetical protein
MVRHKFKAVRCEKDDIKFPSKAEKRYYETLKILQRSGEIVFFLRQPRFDLPGGVKYIADFQIFWANGEVEFIDVKGYDTPNSKSKRKMVESVYPVKIKIVKDV